MEVRFWCATSVNGETVECVDTLLVGTRYSWVFSGTKMARSTHEPQWSSSGGVPAIMASACSGSKACMCGCSVRRLRFQIRRARPQPMHST